MNNYSHNKNQKQNQNRNSGAGCAIGAVVGGIFLMNFIRTIAEDSGLFVAIIPMMFVLAAILVSVFAVISAARKKSAESQRNSDSFIPPRGSQPQRTAPQYNRQPPRQYQGAQGYSAPRRPAPNTLGVYAGHLCDDPGAHATQPREDDVDMMVAINEYSLAQLDRKRFERPLTEEERERSAGAIRELYRSGIIARDEYQYKMEELRRR